MATDSITPPAGYTIEQPSSAPTPPPGYTLEQNISPEVGAAARAAGESQRATMPVLPKMQSDSDSTYGFSPTNMAYQAGEGVRQLAGSAYEMGKDILFPEGDTEKDRLEYLVKKYVTDPADQQHLLAKQSPDAWQALGHHLASVIPFLGPQAASIGAQAGSGDIGGALARGGSQVAAAELVKPAADLAKDSAGAAREAVGTAIHDPATGELTPGAQNLSRAAGTAAGGATGAAIASVPGAIVGAGAGALLGPSLLEKAFPEAKSAVDARAQFEQAKTITEAQEAAIKQNQQFDTVQNRKALALQKSAQDAADLANQAYQQRAEDLMNRQKQQDALDAAAAKADNMAARARRDAEAQHEQELQDIQNARQKDLASAEKLKNQYAQDLMNRQKQQDALDKAASKSKADAQAARDKTAEDLVSRQKQQDVLDRQAVLAAREAWKNRPSAAVRYIRQNIVESSPSSSPGSSAPAGQDLITRMQKITLPGEEPSAEDLKRAGDFTQVPLTKLQTLAKFGDKLAQNEINRRQKN